jgi:2-dehydropantoate 2-reductase
VASGGLRVESRDGDFHLDGPSIARTAAEIGPVDWVVCALKATAVEEVHDLVGPCVDERTRILVLMNGLGLEERFAEWFGADRIFGGLAFTCINRGEPGTVCHLDYGPVTLGHLGDDAEELRVAEELWDGAIVEVQTAPSLLRARWEKLCWNIPFNGLAVTAGGILTDRIVGDSELRAAADTVMREVIASGDADLEAHGEEARIDEEAVVERMFTLTDAMGAYRPSTMIDFVEGRPMEVEAIFGEPLRRARALGVGTPYLALLAAQMRAVDTARE